MWLALAFISAALLGLYDTSKKSALKDNAVLPVLFFNTLFATIIFSPFIISSISGAGWFSGSILDSSPYAGHPETSGSGTGSLMHAHLLVIIKSLIVLASWIFGYFGIKHLPITIVGPINATRPVLVLIGAMLIFGERLNGLQWTGVILSMISLYMLSISSKKEQVDFVHNRWIWSVAAAAVIGAVSGLYDKYIMKELSPMFVQGWYNLYQCVIMAVICAILWYPNRKHTTPLHWSWAIPLISIFISAADFAYFSALNQPDAMISVVSLIRRGSVIVSFACGIIIFKEKNLRAKALDLLLIIIGMVFIYFGSR
ncbi:MAG: EamA family transporter [Bacteroidetes bacterium]|uniref:EamA family transporter n=1 Tax=Candidatus Cryptobacteroides excrementavium TaxID=2840759 RepID=A0A9D9J271_9BACT|nr:EamA family transporter [Candidatus Cryptobacteroides excrementavium]